MTILIDDHLEIRAKLETLVTQWVEVTTVCGTFSIRGNLEYTTYGDNDRNPGVYRVWCNKNGGVAFHHYECWAINVREGNVRIVLNI